MSSSRYEVRRLYSLHVFKDNAGSNWTNPTVHVFPLSSRSARKFGGRSCSGRYAGAGPKGYPGNRDGLVNLYRLPSDQLSFLEQYVGKLNTEVEEQKKKLVKDWKASIQQEEKEKSEKEMKRNEEQMKLLNLKRQYLREREQDGESSAEKQNQGERVTRKTVTRNRSRCGNRYEYDSEDTTRLPDARPYRGRNTLPPSHRGCVPSPATFETPWTIEEVELTFIPEKISLLTPNPTSLGLHPYRMAEPGENQDEIRREVKLEVATNVIAPESFSSFAVVLSRCQGVECPRDAMISYQREYSPARSYFSDAPSQYEAEEDEWAESVEKIDPPKAGIFPPGYPAAPVPSNAIGKQKGSEALSEAGKDEDAFDTESKTGEEGEGCDEGTVYINVVKKA
ncbi:hypothetical protein EV426DRAFT_612590, partial [Tirmania nivea]